MISHFQVNILLKLCLLQLLLCLHVITVALLHVVVDSAQSLLVLFHAQLQTVFKLLFLSEDRGVIHLRDSFPLTVQLLLNVDDHVVSVPFAAVLDILHKGIACFTYFNTGEDLTDLVLFDAGAASLEGIKLGGEVLVL